MANKARGWCFTINNPTRKNLFPHGLTSEIKYIVYQLEQGEQGTVHLQGYIQFNSPRTLKWIKSLKVLYINDGEELVFERAHLEASKGNAE